MMTGPSLGAIMVLAMHAGFAFLEVGTVRRKNQVNALVKILVDFCVSTLMYFFVGYGIAYGVHFFASASTLTQASGYDLVKFFFLLTFAAAIPAIVSGRHRRARALLAAGDGHRTDRRPALPVLRRHRLERQLRLPGLAAGAVRRALPRLRRVHRGACRGRLGRAGGGACCWARARSLSRDGGISAHPPSSIPFLALGAWILTVGWFGFNVMSAQKLEGVNGLVAVNSLMAMVGGTLAALVAGRNDPGFVHNGPLAGLVAVCAGSDLMHPLGALVTGVVAGGMFVLMFTLTQNRWKIDDVLGVWPLHGLCGTWGGIAAGIFGLEALGGLGGVSFMSQLIGGQ
jgi:Amt family ammonium transporter